MELERSKPVFLEVDAEEEDGGRIEEKDGRRREEKEKRREEIQCLEGWHSGAGRRRRGRHGRVVRGEGGMAAR